jgi:hypothetical protein
MHEKILGQLAGRKFTVTIRAGGEVTVDAYYVGDPVSPT